MFGVLVSSFIIGQGVVVCVRSGERRLIMCWGWVWLRVHVTGLLLCRARSGWAVRFVGAEDAPSCPRGGGFATYVADVSIVVD